MVGERVDRYEVVRPIATGGMATVFAVRLRAMAGVEKLFALKVLTPQLAEDEYFVSLFLDECRIASRITHPNVVQLFDVVQHNGLPGMVMELLHGQTLSRLVRRQRLDDAEAAEILGQAARGLDAAHRLIDAAGEPLGLVHRDISPENIHVGYDGVTRIVDFGIAATRARLTETRPGDFKGKIAYAAPERITTPESVDARADVWSMGVLAWQLFAGRDLFVGDNEAAQLWALLNGEIEALAQARPDLDPSIVRVVDAALQRLPQQRRVTAADLAEAMEPVGCGAAALSELLCRAFQAERADEAQLLASPPEPAPRPFDEAVLPELLPSGRSRWLRTATWMFGASLGIAIAGFLLTSRDRAPTPSAAQPEPEPPPSSRPGEDDHQPAARAVGAPPALEDRTQIAAPEDPEEPPRSDEPADAEPSTGEAPARPRTNRASKPPRKRRTKRPSKKREEVFGNPYDGG